MKLNNKILGMETNLIETKRIHRIVKDLDELRIIIGIRAYDKDNNQLHSFRHKDGIGSKKYKNHLLALKISNLPHRKNSAFQKAGNHANQLVFERKSK